MGKMINKKAMNRLNGFHFPLIKVFLLQFVFVAVAVSADLKVTATIDRTRIGLNEQFQLTVEISGANAMSVGEPKLPNMDTFAAYSGSSSSQSFQFINGRMQVAKSYTYYFIAARVGKFKIGPVGVNYRGKQYHSNPIQIEIIRSTAPRSQPQPRTRRRTPASPPASSQNNLGKSLFLKSEINKKRVYLNEPVIVTYKIYTQVQVTDYRLSKQPNFGNFWAEEFPIPNQPPIHQEIMNGQQFSVATIKKVALFPTSAGQTSIPPLSIDANVRVRERRRSRDFFDSFFDDPFFGRIVTYSMSTDPIKIEVLPLPDASKPVNFSGAVGQYSLDVLVDRRQAKTNEAITLKFTVAGTGNIKILSPPRINFPQDFEVYDPKISEKINRANNAIQGYKTFEYVIIPRRPGKFVISNLAYTFFDPIRRKYQTLRNAPIYLKISKGNQRMASSSSGLSKEEVRLLGKDIRYIAKTADNFRNLNSKFYDLPYFWVLLIAPAFIFLTGVYYRSHQERLSTNVAYARSRKAQKIALKQLREAKHAMDKNEVAKFYAETAKALTTFVGNKLNLEEAAMVNDELVNALKLKDVAPELIEEYKNLLTECDFRRFALPDAANEAMAIDYQKAKSVLIHLEKVL